MDLIANRDKLVKLSVQGQIHHPLGGTARIAADGSVKAIPAIGGITYNVKVGDPLFGLAGDHLEPGVSIKNFTPGESDALNVFSCIGNKARVVSGAALGAVGYVTGIHGGCEHVIINFPQEDLYKMKINDEILVEAYGQGMELSGFSDVSVMSIDPALFDALHITVKDGCLQAPVVGIIPAYLMGSGLGAGHSFSGDYDMMTKDRASLEENGLTDLRFGDVVMIEDADNTTGRGYLRGACTIGIVIHGDCIAHGHGPGITTVLSCKKPRIKGTVTQNANIADFIFSRRYK